MTAGQRMVDGLIGLLRDTIFLTMEAAQQAQQAQQPALFFPFLQEQVLVGASLEPPARAGEPAAMEPATAEPQRQPQPPANAIPTASEQEVLSTGEAREGEGEGGSYYYSWWGGAAPEPPSELVFDELMAAAAQEFGHVVGRRLQSALGTVRCVVWGRRPAGACLGKEGMGGAALPLCPFAPAGARARPSCQLVACLVAAHW